MPSCHPLAPAAQWTDTQTHGQTSHPHVAATTLPRQPSHLVFSIQRPRAAREEGTQGCFWAPVLLRPRADQLSSARQPASSLTPDPRGAPRNQQDCGDGKAGGWRAVNLLQQPSHFIPALCHTVFLLGTWRCQCQQCRERERNQVPSHGGRRREAGGPSRETTRETANTHLGLGPVGILNQYFPTLPFGSVKNKLLAPSQTRSRS